MREDLEWLLTRQIRLLSYKDYTGEKLKEIEEKVLKIGNAALLLACAVYIPDCKLKMHEKIVSESNDAKIIFEFARDIKCADKKLLQDAIIKTGNLCDLCFFAQDIKDADIELLKNIINEKITNYKDAYYVSIDFLIELLKDDKFILKTLMDFEEYSIKYSTAEEVVLDKIPDLTKNLKNITQNEELLSKMKTKSR